ncbi:hypothetical protein F8S13_26930 [Chloroflexia bacterium SDU3-3]|nr:hypothetical protein F8S13_26930 [Chloroflexia bacterium SDU3-3]
MAMHCFTLTPYDGACYTVVFSRLPRSSDPDATAYMFGIAKYGKTVIVLSFMADDADLYAFDWHWRHANGIPDARDMAPVGRCVFAALMGISGVPTPKGWNTTWRDQLPNDTRQEA